MVISFFFISSRFIVPDIQNYNKNGLFKTKTNCFKAYIDPTRSILYASYNRDNWQVFFIFELLDFAHLNKGNGLAWASQSNVTAWPWIFQIPSNLDLGGNRGGLLPTGSKNEKGKRITSHRGVNRYLHVFALIRSTWSARRTFRVTKSESLCSF